MVKMAIKINKKVIGDGCAPFIIAEMSGNHNQSLDRALSIVEAAAAAGVDALKIQTYTPDTMTINDRKGDFYISDPKSLWKGTSLYELYQKAALPWEWHKPIFNLCKKLGMIGFSTAYDETAVDFLESLNVPLYKIASFENVDIPLIKKVARTGKPVIISTGMATIEEIDRAVSTARRAGCRKIVLLKCTSAYPAEPNNANIVTIPDLRQRFHCLVGISDHAMGIGVSVASVALQATVIEKHFTLSRTDGGVDSTFSMEPDEMCRLVVEAKRAWQSLGKVKYGVRSQEKNSLVFRRSIYVVNDVKKGESLTKDNIRIIRPGNGLAPLYFEQILGKKAKHSLPRGTALKWNMFH